MHSVRLLVRELNALLLTLVTSWRIHGQCTSSWGGFGIILNVCEKESDVFRGEVSLAPLIHRLFSGRKCLTTGGRSSQTHLTDDLFCVFTFFNTPSSSLSLLGPHRSPVAARRMKQVQCRQILVVSPSKVRVLRKRRGCTRHYLSELGGL